MRLKLRPWLSSFLPSMKTLLGEHRRKLNFLVKKKCKEIHDSGPRKLQFLCQVHLSYITRSLQAEESSYIVFTVKVNSNLVSSVKDRIDMVNSVKERSYLVQPMEKSSMTAQAGIVENILVIRMMLLVRSMSSRTDV